MTNITFFRSDGIFYGFEEKGHVGYGDWGEDPFCAMLSSSTMFIVDAIEDVYHVFDKTEEMMRRSEEQSNAGIWGWSDDDVITFGG